MKQKQNTRKIRNKNLILYLKKWEKVDGAKPKVSRRKERSEEINEIETKKAIEKINETKSRFYKKINKIDKSLTRPNKQKRVREGTNKIRNERERI